jgi:hypothetical protein
MTTRNHLRRFASSAKEDENLANPTAWNARLRAWMMAMAPGTATWMLKREAPTNATHTAATLGNVIGLASFVWAVQQFFDEKRRADDRNDRQEALRALDRASAHARREKPRAHLVQIKRGMLNNFAELERQQQGRQTTMFSLFSASDGKLDGEQHDDIDNLADSWLQHRNEGKRWAVELDDHRTSLKNVWFTIMSAYERNEKNAEVFKDLLFSEYPLGKEVALKTLLALEPLDKAACRANVSKTAAGKCDWSNHAPKIFPFIRKVYGVPCDWPRTITVKTKDDYAQQDDKLIKTKMDSEVGKKVVRAAGEEEEKEEEEEQEREQEEEEEVRRDAGDGELECGKSGVDDDATDDTSLEAGGAPVANGRRG